MTTGQTLNADEFIHALALPIGARVHRRVPKSLLVDHSAPTAADKRRINDGIGHVHWVATLKPSTIGVPIFRDTAREYLEIAVLRIELRQGAGMERLAELVHRAIPYPVLMLLESESGAIVSLAHKRWSLGAANAMVLDGDPLHLELVASDPDEIQSRFRDALAIERLPRADMFGLYQGWFDALLALQAARRTGRFVLVTTAEQLVARRDALRECANLDGEISRLRAAAVKERQLPRQVALNLELKRAESARDAALARL